MDQERQSESKLLRPRTSVQIERCDGGPPSIAVTVHAATVDEATRLAREQYDALVRLYATPANGVPSPAAEADAATPDRPSQAARPDQPDDVAALLQASVPLQQSASLEPSVPVQPSAPLQAPVPVQAVVQAPPPSPSEDGNGADAAAPTLEVAPEPTPGVLAEAPRVTVGSLRSDSAGALRPLAASGDRSVLILGAAGALLSWLAWMAIYRHGSQPLIWDANEYFGLAKQLIETGLGGWSNPQRTYAFPYFVSFFIWRIGDNWVRVQQAVSFTTWLVNLGVGVALGLAVARAFASHRRGLLAFGLIALNPFLIAQTTALLSDSLSGSAIAFAVIPLVAAWRQGLRPATVAWLMTASVFCASVAVEIRPGNLVIMPAIGALWVARAAWFRSYPWRWLPLVLVGLMLPLLPQMLANQRTYGVPTPLTAATGPLDDSIRAGLTRLKSRTSVVPNMPAQLNHENPFYPPTARTAGEFFALSPAGYVATLFVHGVALVDIDLPYTYVFDYHPWYRWPLSVLSAVYWLLAVVGLAPTLARAVRRRTIEPATWVMLAPAVVAAPYFSLYVTLGPDPRYGIPLYLLAVPSVVAGLVRVRGSARRSRRHLAGWAVATLIVVAAWASLSAWITQQAPALRG